MKPNSPNHITEAQSRRTFLKTAATATAAVAATGIVKTPVYGQTQAPSLRASVFVTRRATCIGRPVGTSTKSSVRE